MQELTITKHAEERMSQRMITFKQIQKILELGTTRKTKRNSVTQIGWLTRCLNSELLEDIACICVVHRGQTIITVYR